ncbi:MAG: hypothetical protein BMS9Abin05_2259 [Rhodothermia bacterium]|nr:MAG: hypothetical protein BMS9Abin05_2259 [Rhodothermia bacterium]
MASLFKRGELYHLSFYSKNRTPIRKQIPLRTRSRRTAEKLQIKLEDETALGLVDPWSNASGAIAKSIPDALGSATEAFLIKRSNLSKQSIQKYRSVLGQLVSFLGPEQFVSQIGSDGIQKFLNARERIVGQSQERPTPQH